MYCWKKIASGFGNVLGKVDLYGHETPPTKKDRNNNLTAEDNLLDCVISDIQRFEDMDKDDVSDLTDDFKQMLHQQAIDAILLLSNRNKETRLAIVKFMKMAGDN